MGRPAAQLRIAVPGRTTTEVTARLQAATGLGGGLHQQLFVKQHRDGSFSLHVPEDRGGNYPVLRATVEDDGGTAVLRGLARESGRGRRTFAMMWFLALLMAFAGLVSVVMEAWPNAMVCAVGVVAVVGISVFRYRSRRPVFETGVEQLRWAIGRLLQIDPLTSLAAHDPELGPQANSAMLALADRVDAGATDAECLWDLQNLAGVLRRSVPGGFVSVSEARRLATSKLQEYRDAGPAERAEIRARLENGDRSQSG